MTHDNESVIADAIDAAEDIRDPLEGLAEKTVTYPDAPFMPDALERLAALKKEDRASFEALRAQLKKAGCRVTALDESIAEENGGMGGRGPTQADILIELAQEAELFHVPDGTGLPISTSTAIAKPGRSAPRAFAGGWRAASSRRRKARRVRKCCNRR
jgi:hypothetical protein